MVNRLRSSTGRSVVRKLLLVLATAGLLIATATSATAAAPGPGTSTGVGSVFVPNPVQSLGDQSLTDRKYADAAVPAAAYHDVTLTNLDGGGFLHGDYATVVSETGNLGFGETRRAINNRPQAVRINQLGYDNSFATDHPKNELRFGKGGVDDAEDGEVILHEYGHAIHFAQNFSFASEQAGAISEGFGDYWAVTVGDVVSRSLGVPARAPLPASPTGRRLLHQNGP